MSTEEIEVEKKKVSPEKQAVFTPEYVSELREENKSLREKIAEVEKNKNEELTKKVQEFDTIINEKLQDVASQYKKELLISKLENEAIKSGIVDVDAIKLADLTTVEIDENNKISGAAEAISKLKETKPYLFSKKGENSTTHHRQPPMPASEREKIDVTKLDAAAYSAYLQKMGIDPTKI